MIEKNPVLKVVMVGDGGVGKTCIVNKFVYDQFFENDMTIGAAFNAQILRIMAGNMKIDMDVTIWDLGGQGEYYYLLPYFIENTNGIIFVFDVSSYSRHSLESLYKRWKPLLEPYLKTYPSILVGSKLDLLDEKKVNYSPETINDYREKLGCAKYIELSAKTGVNITEAFYNLVAMILKNPPYNLTDLKFSRISKEL